MLVPAVALMPEPPSRRRYLVVVAATIVSVVVQIPGVLVTNVLIEALRDDLLSQEERKQMLPMYPATVVALWHKTVVGTDIYPVTLFGIAGDRTLDGGAVYTPRLRGFSIWTELIARRSRYTQVRWLAVLAALFALYLATAAAREMASEGRGWPGATSGRGPCPPTP
jgi:hypothetical protein